MVSLMTGIPVADLEKQEVKDRVLGDEWGYSPESKIYSYKLTVRQLLQKLGTDAIRDNVHPNAWVNSLFADYKAYSKGKAHDGLTLPEYYVGKTCGNCLRAFGGYKRQPYCRECTNDPNVQTYPNWIITDCRFPNEADAILERGGLVIRVNRPHPYKEQCLACGKTAREQAKGCSDITCYKGRAEHPSETALDNWVFGHQINNSGTIEELIEQVRTILIEAKII